MPEHAFAALVLAAGSGTRLGADVPKGWLEIDGLPIWLWSAQRLARVPGHCGSVLALDRASIETRLPPFRARLEGAGIRAVIEGGQTRQDSCTRAHLALSDCGVDAALVAIHDAARPFFDIPSVGRALASATEHGAAILGSRARDTLKRVDASGRITGTVDRSAIFHAATPQVFRREVFERMLAFAASNDVQGTDEAGLAEACGIPVQAVDSPSTNIKLTFPEDLALIPALRRFLNDA